jgi:endonuclease III
VYNGIAGHQYSLNPPTQKHSTRVEFDVPGKDFICMAKDCFQLMEIFLTSCSFRDVSPNRWNWDYILVDLMEKLQKLDKYKATPDNEAFAKLVCLVLSANTKDNDCISCTAELAEAGLLDVQAMAEKSNRVRIKKIIKRCGYQRKRSKYLMEMANKILSLHYGKVPRTIGELMEFKGVARKTAVLTLNEAFGLFEGIGCDIHVIQNCIAFQFLQLKSSTAKVGPIHAEMALRHWIGREKYPIVNKVFGSFSQLFTQMLGLRSGTADPSVVTRICKAMTDYIHQTYHVELLFCLIKCLRKQYRVSASPSKKKYLGTKEGDTDTDSK